ncbi:hypothetical protein TTHT_2114 [Thermotomaculum hydrothermale]|uniref:Prepilin-type N-terminal cleavage/methylation domain-containing protein n=1 Tax=Thermotomaculum hydrothermale TaxID=981385 RepID=A0A7R6SZB5_9BACT|nr:prepilin-type N-terminal cleavage/methylation domain-containing protein [Thermotomaculum hydrothermale]BBB33550.1 hypothetical protein TTHT_2114 [Thermotomaculum hydrothermale]
MKSNRGFSMIELMIAAAIFAFAMLAIAGMSYTSVYLVSSSNSRFTATTLASSVIEQARNHGQAWASSLDGDVKYFDEVGNEIDSQGGQMGVVFRRTITTQTLGTGTLMKVKVTWTERGEVKNVIQSAIIY